MAPQEINAYYSQEFNKIGKISVNVPVAVTPCMNVHCLKTAANFE